MVEFFNTLARKQCFLSSESFNFFRNPERSPYTVQFMLWEGTYRARHRERKRQYVITLKRKIMRRGRDKEGKNVQRSLVSTDLCFLLGTSYLSRPVGGYLAHIGRQTSQASLDVKGVKPDIQQYWSRDNKNIYNEKVFNRQSSSNKTLYDFEAVHLVFNN